MNHRPHASSDGQLRWQSRQVVLIQCSQRRPSAWQHAHAGICDNRRRQTALQLPSCMVACFPLSASYSRGGFAKCNGFQRWSTNKCKLACNAPGASPSTAGQPSAVTGLTWACAANSIYNGETCTQKCDAGYEGTVTSTCDDGKWGAPVGTCKPVACAAPPAEPVPNAVWGCVGAQLDQKCSAKCNSPLSGSIYRVCIADPTGAQSGIWGPLQGDASCVDCAANAPKLTGPAATTIPEGTTTASVKFTFIAPYISDVKFTATLNGQSGQCTVDPASLSGGQATEQTITATCSLPAGSAHKVAMQATYTGSNLCSSGTLDASASIYVGSVPGPAPTLKLEGVPSFPVCKPAAGASISVSASFNFGVTLPAGATPGSQTLDAVATATPAGLTCSWKRTGTLDSGAIVVSCTGPVDAAATSVTISATLKASVPGSNVGSISATQAVPLACCIANTVAHLTNTFGDGCKPCGPDATNRDGIYNAFKKSGTGMEVRAGKITDCQGTGTTKVGTWRAETGSSWKYMRIVIDIPAGGSLSSVSAQAHCWSYGVAVATSDNVATCQYKNDYGTFDFAPVSGMSTTTNADGSKTYSFELADMKTLPTCYGDSQMVYAVKVVGTLPVPPNASGGCPSAAPVSIKRRGGGVTSKGLRRKKKSP